MGVIHRARIESVEVKRTLSVSFNPNRYRSKAAEAFTKEILPQFTNRELSFSKVSNKTAKAAAKAAAKPSAESKPAKDSAAKDSAAKAAKDSAGEKVALEADPKR